jgi:hypothetical protein
MAATWNNDDSQRITMKLIREVHRSELMAIQKRESDSGKNDAENETEALLGLTALRLEGLRVKKIENIEPFDKCMEIYLHQNRISTVEVRKHEG